MNDISLKIPSDANYIDLVRICLYGIASKQGYSYEDIEDMKVAVSEACNNAVLYGEKSNQSCDIEINFLPTAESLQITIKNVGPAFEHMNALQNAAPAEANQISELQVGGLGIYLMQALMDEVHVDREDQSTIVTLIKYKGD